MTKTVYLTIDDGPSADFEKKIDFMNAHGVKAVWFCQGNFLQERPQMSIKALQTGHIIANHSFSHPHFSEISVVEGHEEIQRTDAIIAELYKQAGVNWQKKYFRFPYIDNGSGTSVFEQLFESKQPNTPEKAAAFQSFLRELGYEQPAFEGIAYDVYHLYANQNVDVFATFDTEDWKMVHDMGDGQALTQAVLDRMDGDDLLAGLTLSDPSSSAVMVCHDHDAHSQNLDLFKQIIRKALDKGMIFALPAVS